MQAFIWQHRTLYSSQKIFTSTVVTRMPNTLLRLEELARVEEIKTFLIDDLWDKKFVQEVSLTTSE